MHEVAVIGAGMAGMAAVRSLVRHKRDAILIAPTTRRAPASRGETLSPRAAPTLERLGWRDLLDTDAAAPIGARYSVWGSSRLVRDESASGIGLGWHVDRGRLEGLMSDRLSAANLTRVADRVRKTERRPLGWRLHLAAGEVVDARFVIDCSGRTATSSKHQAGRRGLDRLVAVFATLAVPEAEMAPATLVEAAAAGWWYTSLVPGGNLFVALFSDADLLPKTIRREPGVWARLLAGTTATSSRLGSLGLTLDNPPTGSAAAASLVRAQIVEDGLVRAGDAAAAFDPLASNGLASALWSGAGAADAVAAALGGDPRPLGRYESAFRAGISSFLVEHSAVYAAERRFSGATFWERRHRASAPFFEDGQGSSARAMAGSECFPGTTVAAP